MKRLIIVAVTVLLMMIASVSQAQDPIAIDCSSEGNYNCSDGGIANQGDGCYKATAYCRSTSGCCYTSVWTYCGTQSWRWQSEPTSCGGN
jgi:hypothetical protein